MGSISLILLNDMYIFEQLQLEEALLRNSKKSYCIINTNSKPAIVMGISSKPEELVYIEKAKRQNIPLIRRYSGGGCVVVDEDTLFVTFILSKQDLPIPFFPEKIMKWTESIYARAFDTPHFSLLENDYVLNNKKFGGNAQYVQKDRFVHHTSFLWDYNKQRMQLLKHPPKKPFYRKEREHKDFITTMNSYFPCKIKIITQIVSSLEQSFTVCKADLQEEHYHVQQPHRKSVSFINI